MPRLLLITLCAAIAVLAADAIYWAWNAESFWDLTVVGIDIAALTLLSLLHRRNQTITEWVKSIALIWGSLGLILGFLGDPFQSPELFLAIEPLVEGIVLLALFFILKRPASRHYLESQLPT